VAAAIAAIDALPSPWFLFLHTYAVHVPYEPDEATARRLDPGYAGGLGWKLDALTMTRINNGVIPVTTADVRHVEELYDALVAGADAAAGRLFDALRSRGLLESTIVVVTSDHGEEFDEHGVIGWHALTCYDEVQRAALIVKPAGPAPAERRVEAGVRSIDIAPTILELAGVPIPEAMWGRTLSGLMAGAREPEREALCEIEDGRGAAILAGRWKYHRRTPESADDPRTFRRRIQTHGRYGAEELYDLSRDPFEQVNRAASDPDRARELRRLLETRLGAARGALAAALEGRAAPPRPREDDEHMKRLRALGYVQ
jgi:arylsulfatase A-like enzyme